MAPGDRSAARIRFGSFIPTICSPGLLEGAPLRIGDQVIFFTAATVAVSSGSSVSANTADDSRFLRLVAFDPQIALTMVQF